MASGMPLSNCHSDDEVWARAVASAPRDVRWGRAVWTRLRPAYSRSRRRNGGDHQVAERRVARRVHREIDRVRRRPSAGPWRCSRPLQPYGQDRAAGGSRLATVTRPWIRKGDVEPHVGPRTCGSTRAGRRLRPKSNTRPHVSSGTPPHVEHDPSGRIGVRKSQPPTTAASTAASRSSSVDVHVEGDPPQGQRPEKRTASATKHQHRLLHHHIEVIERRPRHALAPSEFGCHASDVTRPADLQPNDLRVCNTPESATSREDVLGPGRAASGNIPTSATREIRSAQLAPGEPHLYQTVERLRVRIPDPRPTHQSHPSSRVPTNGTRAAPRLTLEEPLERPPERGPADRPRLQGPGRRRTSTSSAPTPEIRACVTSRMRSPSSSRCGCTRRAERTQSISTETTRSASSRTTLAGTAAADSEPLPRRRRARRCCARGTS